MHLSCKVWEICNAKNSKFVYTQQIELSIDGRRSNPPPPPPTKLTREREIERERGRERERRGGEGVECFHFMFFTKINGRYLPIINITATTAQIPML